MTSTTSSPPSTSEAVAVAAAAALAVTVSIMVDLPQYSPSTVSALPTIPNVVIVTSKQSLYDASYSSIAPSRIYRRPPSDLSLWREAWALGCKGKGKSNVEATEEEEEEQQPQQPQQPQQLQQHNKPKPIVVCHRHDIPHRYQGKGLVDVVLDGNGPWGVRISNPSGKVSVKCLREGAGPASLGESGDLDLDLDFDAFVFYTPGQTFGSVAVLVPGALLPQGSDYSRDGILFGGNSVPLGQQPAERLDDEGNVSSNMGGVKRQCESVREMGRDMGRFGVGPGYLVTGKEGAGMMQGVGDMVERVERYEEYFSEGGEGR